MGAKTRPAYAGPLLAIDLFPGELLNIIMKRSQLLGRTLRESPLVPDPWTELALRAALVRFVNGQIVYLPLGERVITRLTDIFGSIPSLAQEVRLPPGLLEEGWSEFLQDEIQSYRQLPITLITQRIVKSVEPTQGLARPHWRRVMQWLRTSTTTENLRDYQNHWMESVETVWSELGLSPRWSEWKPSEFGWSYVHESGPDAMLSCTNCGYIGNS